jgi:hypothetical protein
MLYETLKWPQIAPFCISSNKIPDLLALSRIMASTILSLSYAPTDSVVVFVFLLIEQYYRTKHEFA